MGLRKASIGLAGLSFVLAVHTLAAGSALAQEGPGGAINPGRDCQTITTCNFTKGGSFRGCVSSYSCRVCRFVAASCVVGGTRKRCLQSVCTWG